MLYLRYKRAWPDIPTPYGLFEGWNEVPGSSCGVTRPMRTDRPMRGRIPKFIIVLRIRCRVWEYPDAVALMKRFPKSDSFGSARKRKSQPMEAGALRLRYICDHEEPGGSVIRHIVKAVPS